MTFKLTQYYTEGWVFGSCVISGYLLKNKKSFGTKSSSSLLFVSYGPQISDILLQDIYENQSDSDSDSASNDLFLVNIDDDAFPMPNWTFWCEQRFEVVQGTRGNVWLQIKKQIVLPLTHLNLHI